MPAALEIARRDPVAFVLVIGQLEEVKNPRSLGTQLWGFPAQGPLEAVCWAGSNLMPVLNEPNSAAIKAFAQLAKEKQRNVASIVGPADHVMELWSHLSGTWPTPREIRNNQPSLAISAPSPVGPDQDVRWARATDYEALFPASVAMFQEEVGISPLLYGSSAYSTRVKYLIAARRSLLRMGPQEGRAQQQVIFKADLGAVTSQVAQVQGVWVTPSRRGQGLAGPAMAAVVNQGLRVTAPQISLYVNDFNTRALRVYYNVGFEQVGTFATILF